MPKLRRISGHVLHASRFTRDDAAAPRGIPTMGLAAGSCVYFIACGGYIKIGTTTSTPQARFAGMQLPPDAELVGAIFDAGRAQETQLHQMFKAHRVRGEWFERTPELDALISVHSI